MQRGGGGEVAEAMVVDHTEDGGVLEAGDGLAGLVAIGEDDELRLSALGGGFDGVISIGAGTPASSRSLADSAGSGPKQQAV